MVSWYWIDSHLWLVDPDGHAHEQTTASIIFAGLMFAGLLYRAWLARK